MSLNTATKEQLKELIQYISDNICLPIIGVGGGDAPIGKMGMFDAIVAPQGWLIADGSEYNIDDYPELATHIASTHGSMNYYGGDGTTTFAVPDWQGEFFRASGTNSRTDQGNGAAVGVHQDATEHIFEYGISTGGFGNRIASTDTYPKKYDKTLGTSTQYVNFTSTDRGNYEGATHYASRPTNTSLLCCIKATPQGHQYSEKEQIVGSWIDGKPLYQKTLSFTSPNVGDIVDFNLGISNASVAIFVENASYIEVPASNGAKQYIPLNTYLRSDVSTGFLLQVESNGIVKGVMAVKDANWQNRPCKVTVQYTKITD